MVHLFEIPQNNAEVRLTDYNKYFVTISYQNNKLIVIEPNPKGVLTNNLTIPVIKINTLETKITQDLIKAI